MQTLDSFMPDTEQQESAVVRPVLIFEKPAFDAESAGVLHRLREHGLTGIESVRTGKMFLFQGFAADEVARIETELLHQPVHTEKFSHGMTYGADICVPVAYKPQMTNPELASIEHAIGRRGISMEGKRIQTASMYVLHGTCDERTKQQAEALLMNDAVQVGWGNFPQSIGMPDAPEADTVESLALSAMNSVQLMALSGARRLFLTEQEMLTIQAHFRELGREPTDAEIETIAQTWSEHCCHKTFKAGLVINGERKAPLFTRLKNSTRDIAHPDVVSCFEDNAGVVKFDDQLGIAIKFETHNAPTALDSFGGANTGLGGVIRDIMGTGLGAEPIAGSDVLLFGDPRLSDDAVPPGTLHPKRLMTGAVAGIRDYGNKIGLPNISGAVYFDSRFGPKPGILAGSIGKIPLADAMKGKAKPGDHLLCIGGKTGKDGIHGATFSSGGMSDKTGELDSAAVQIGYPVLEREIMYVIEKLREGKYINAITDCGAGGISSAITEMCHGLGARIQLERLSMKFRGLLPWQKWISESQERMVIAVSPDRAEEAIELCRHYGINVDDLGICGAGDNQLHVTHGEKNVIAMDLDFLLKGNPLKEIEGRFTPPQLRPEPLPAIGTPALRSLLLAVLQDLNVCSREGIVSGYDHTVTGGPTDGFSTGKKQDAPSDGIILRPLPGVDRGLIVTHGLAPKIADIDPYHASVDAVVEAIANAVARGADPAKIFLVDNFLHPPADNPDDVGTLDRSMDGLTAAALAFGTPLVSGKDSLGMKFKRGELVIKAPPTLVISALSILDSLQHTVPGHFQQADSQVMVLGTADPRALAGSVGAEHMGLTTNAVPVSDPEEQKKIFAGLHAAMKAGQVRSCHDIHDGGLFATVAEMSFGNELGASLQLSGTQQDATGTLLSEKAGRFVLELPPDADPAQLFPGLPFTVLGKTTAEPAIGIALPSGETISYGVAELKDAHRNPVLEDAFPIAKEPAGPLPRSEKKAGVSSLRTVSKGGKPRVLVVRAPGTNSERELAESFRIAGASPVIVHMADLQRRHFTDAQILAIAGGFSYGDDIRSGQILAQDLVQGFRDEMQEFADRDTLTIGICNGMQVLLQAGALPYGPLGAPQAYCLNNKSGRFICCRIELGIEDSRCKWTESLRGKTVRLPVAHGEGRFHAEPEILERIERDKLVAFRYVDPAGEPTMVQPYNPNGSLSAIAGITDISGKTVILMPHPERDPRNFAVRYADIEEVIGLDILRGGVQRY